MRCCRWIIARGRDASGINYARWAAQGCAVTKLAVIGVCVAAAMLAGCAATPTREALAVHDADAAMVKGCTFVGYVTGTSGWSGVAAGPGESNAQNEARAKAAKLGATDIVWQSVKAGWGSTANGNAYRCPSNAK